MNEREFGRAVARYLNHGAYTVDQKVATRLAEARKNALQRYATASHPVLAGVSGHREPLSSIIRKRYSVSHLWAPLIAIVLAIMVMSYWQITHPPAEPSEIDVHLLADDLPINAYTDSGFEAWLESSSQ